MGACGSKSAKKNFSGEGHSLQPSQQPGAATTEKTSPTNPTSPIRSPIQSPGYRLGGGDPEKVEPGTPTTNGGLSSPPPPVNATDPSEREKRLQAIAQREDKLAGKTVRSRVF